MYGAGVLVGNASLKVRIEGVCLVPALVQQVVKAPEGVGQRAVRQPQPHAGRAMGGHFEFVMHRGLGAGLLRIDGGKVSSDDVVVEGILVISLGSFDSIEPGDVRLVVAEQEFGVAFRGEGVFAQMGMTNFDGARPGGRQPRFAYLALPGPGVAEPELRQQVEDGLLGAAVVDRHLHEQIFWPGLGVLDEDIEVAVVVEDAGVQQFVLGLVLAPAATFLDELAVGELALRVLVEHLEVGVGRSGIKVVVNLLHILAVVALPVGQPEQPLLQDWITAVPQGQGQAQALLVVADAGQAILAPAVGPAAGMVMGKEIPGGAAGAVVLAYGAPLALAEVRAPLAPRLPAEAVFLQPLLLFVHDLRQQGLPSRLV